MQTNELANAISEGKVAVLVLGMHRSGTSMLSGMLEQLGCRGSETKIDGNERNPRGYFESPKVKNLNDTILEELGTRWDGWQILPAGWQGSPRFDMFREQIADVMASEFGSAALICLKDPRICRLLPLWREVLVEAGYTIVCIHIHRNPVDVTRSLQARTGIEVEPGLGMLLWLRHVLDAEAASRDLPRIFTSYERILANWTDFSHRAEKSFGFSWPVTEQARDAQIRDVMDAALRHHHTPIDAFLDDSHGSDLVKDCLRVLERWAENGEDEAGREMLDRIRERFEHAAVLFSQPLAELATRGTVLQDDLKKSQSELTALRTKAEASRENLAKVSVALAASAESVQSLQHERDVLSAREAVLRDDLRLTNDQLAMLRAEVEIRQAELEVKPDNLVKELREAKAELAALRQERDGLVKLVATLDTQLADAETHQGELQAELNEFTDKIINRDKAAAAMHKECDKLVREKAKLVAQLAEQEAASAKAIEELNVLYLSSTSWRISAPIRILGRLLKHRDAR